MTQPRVPSNQSMPYVTFRVEVIKPLPVHAKHAKSGHVQHALKVLLVTRSRASAMTDVQTSRAIVVHLATKRPEFVKPPNVLPAPEKVIVQTEVTVFATSTEMCQHAVSPVLETQTVRLTTAQTFSVTTESSLYAPITTHVRI